MKRLVTVIVLLGMLFLSVGCDNSKVKQLSSGMDVEEPEVVDITENNTVITDFALRLFQNSLEEENNTVIAPVSVLTALSMAANGADGNTLSEIEEVIGLPIDELNKYMYSYHHHLSETSDENNKLYVANSIWIKDDKELTIHDSFLLANETYYDSAVYKTVFDEKCVETINGWVNENTQGLIPEIIDNIPKETIMYLINTLVYDGKWEEPYTDIRDGFFTSIQNTLQEAEFMYSEEDMYLEDENAVGFMKYYQDKKYAFAALLPDKDISIEEYIDGLTGEQLHEILSNPIKTRVDTSMPKFTSEYNVMMSDTLKNMGIEDAFSVNVADFSKLGYKPDYKILLNEVIHKTHIDVNEKGMTAAAVTAIEGFAITSAPNYKVNLDRPFVYVLVDCENNIPLFIGVVMNIG